MKLTPLDPWIARKIGAKPSPLDRSDLEAYQLARLQAILHTVRNKSAFYRDQLTGFPSEMSTLQDLTTLPFTTAEDVRRAPGRFLCVAQSEVQRVVTLHSSGTTGLPKRLYFSQADQELTLDFFQVGMSTFTNPGDCVLILLPVERPGSVGDLLAVALARMGAYGIRQGPVRDVAQTLETLFDEQANALVGVPTQVLSLVRSKTARRFPVPKIETVLLTMDHVPVSVVGCLEQAWPCTVYNHYGMTEMGLGGGVECVARQGYHLREADLYFEIIDPVSGVPVADGEMGEIVFTTLTREAMPLVRYRTGDLSRFLPGPCPCGTQLKTLAPVRVRLQDRIALGGDMCVSMGMLDEILFSFDSVLDFAATLERVGEENQLTLDVYLAEVASGSLIKKLCEALAVVPAVRSGVLVPIITGHYGPRHVQSPHAKRMIEQI